MEKQKKLVPAGLGDTTVGISQKLDMIIQLLTDNQGKTDTILTSVTENDWSCQYTPEKKKVAKKI
jgi:hypothetical protein